MRPKPAHLGPEYGAQFSDQRVADAYPTRPPYPPQIIETLAQLARDQPRKVLELGCGTGDITRYLAPQVDHIDALDISAPMLQKARTLPNGNAANIRWIHQAAEAFDYPGPCALVCAAESLHWMEWDVIFPKIRRALSPNGRLAIVFGRELGPMPWYSELGPLFARYSTNRDFQPFDLIEELTLRNLFVLEGRLQTTPVRWSQPLADYLESFHSRNGFSRERMGESAREFDEQLAALVSPYSENGLLHFTLTAQIAWGLPEMLNG